VRRTAGPYNPCVRAGQENLARLLEECRSGKEGAWEEIVRRYRSLVFSLPLHAFGLSPEDAAEVFQETFCSLLEGLDTIRNPESLPFWLASTAANHSRVLIRRESKGQRGLKGLRDKVRRERESGGVPQRTIEAAEIRLALESLDPVCQEILRARYYREPPLSYKEIARETGLALGAVGPRRIRCLKRLLTILGKEPDEQDR